MGAPVYNKMFRYAEYSKDIHTSDKMLASLPKYHTKFSENNLTYSAVVYWNLLSLSFDQFKKA